MARELPTFAASAYASNTVALGSPSEAWGNITGIGWSGSGAGVGQQEQLYRDAVKQGSLQRASVFSQRQPTIQEPSEENQMAVARRVVQVFVADTNENVPLDTALLYKGEPKFTDLTDQELFFELDIKALLTAHNDKRVKLVDKKVKDRTEYLEAAKVRDLKMSVVTIASF